MKFTMALVPEAGSVYLTLFLNDSDEERYELYLRLEGSHLSCGIITGWCCFTTSATDLFHKE
jgi:hypothetical protein